MRNRMRDRMTNRMKNRMSCHVSQGVAWIRVTVMVGTTVSELWLTDQDKAARSAGKMGREKQRVNKRSWASDEGERLGS